MDTKGNAATWTGSECFEWAGGYAGRAFSDRGVVATGKGYAIQGNVLAVARRLTR